MVCSKRLLLLFFLMLCNHINGQSQRPLNILFVVEYFPSLSQVYILNVITGLIDRGHNISIFAFSRGDTSSIHTKVQKYDLLNHVTYENFPEQLPDYDIVFCQFGDLGQRILKMNHLSEWLQQRKLVVCFRGFDVTGYAKNDPKLNRQIFDKIDLFLPVCDYFKKRLVGLGCASEKIIVHHSAIDCSQFIFKKRIMPKDYRINFLSVGRFVKKKGIEYAIKAIASIAEKYPHVHFTIIGEGPERDNLKSLINKLNMQKNIELSRWKSQEEIIAISNQSHIFLLPSITRSNGNEEGIANALKEAMAMGLISIATWHAGTPELIKDGVSGFLVPEKDTKNLANKIEYVIRHPEKWESIALSARKKVEDDFEINKLAYELEILFYRLLGLNEVEGNLNETNSNDIVESSAFFNI